MEYAKKKVHSFIKCHGGKSRYARQYIEVMNKSGCDYYCEPYYGGGGVHLNIAPDTFDGEYIHDADEYIYKSLLALIQKPHKVKELLRTWPYDPISFANAQRLIGSGIDYKHAAGYIARNRMSRSGLFKDFAQSERERGGRMGDLNAYENFVNDYIVGTIERLSYPGIKLFEPTCTLAVMKALLIPRNRRGKTLFFLDPPYLHETRVTPNAYRKEVDRQHHMKLLDFLIKANYKHAKFYICGYMSTTYELLLSPERGWKLHTFDRPSDAGQTEKKARRVECLWESP